jgi:hypothetical protein
MRRDRGLTRMKTSSPASVRLSRGDKRCRGNLVDFSPTSCAIRINDPAFENWTVADLKSSITITLYGEMRSATLTRIQRVRGGFSEAWVLGMVFR